MIKPNFTINELITEVRRLANENPNFTYEGTPGKYSYIEGGDPDAPGCIFGRACRNLDPLMKDYFEINDGEGIYYHLYRLGLAYHAEDRTKWCIIAQQRQDNGACWKDAVYFADINYPLDKDSNM